MQGKPLDILLVEDNDAHAELVIDSLREHRIANKVRVLSDGKEALDYLFRLGAYSDPIENPRPQLVLLDLRLPKVDGLDVLKRVKEDEDLSGIPIVVLTSSAADKDIQRAYDCRANSYLTKPVQFDDFTAMMETLGFYWLAWNKYAEA